MATLGNGEEVGRGEIKETKPKRKPILVSRNLVLFLLMN